jgi:hypothetical protein
MNVVVQGGDSVATHASAGQAWPQAASGGGRAVSMAILVLGAATLPAAIWLLARAVADGVVGPVPSFVFGNAQRLPHEIAVHRSAQAYPLNVAIMMFWTVVVVLLAVHYAALLWRLLRVAPLATLVAATFLGGAAVMGVAAGLSILKVSEFAVQSLLMAPAEQAWLESGITFMNQLHLFYVHSWVVCTALGLLALGRAALVARWHRATSRLVAAAGLAVLAGAIARAWLPAFGPEAPALVVLMSDQLLMVAVAGGWLATGLLGWRHAGGTRRTEASI